MSHKVIREALGKQKKHTHTDWLRYRDREENSFLWIKALFNVAAAVIVVVFVVVIVAVVIHSFVPGLWNWLDRRYANVMHAWIKEYINGIVIVNKSASQCVCIRCLCKHIYLYTPRIFKLNQKCLKCRLYVFNLAFILLFSSLAMCVCVRFFFQLVCCCLFFVYFYLLQAIYYPNNYRSEYLLLSMRDTIFVPWFIVFVRFGVMRSFNFFWLHFFSLNSNSYLPICILCNECTSSTFSDYHFLLIIFL